MKYYPQNGPFYSLLFFFCTKTTFLFQKSKNAKFAFCQKIFLTFTSPSSPSFPAHDINHHSMEFIKKPSNIKLAILPAVNVFFGLWLFISISYHISRAVSVQYTNGISARAGFAWVCWELFNLAFWAGLTFVGFVKYKSIDAEIYTAVVVAAAFWGVIVQWIVMFWLAGYTSALATFSRGYNYSYVSSADASIAALALSFVVSVCYVALMVLWKKELLNPQGNGSDQLPDQNISQEGYVQHQEQAGYYADSSSYSQPGDYQTRNFTRG